MKDRTEQFDRNKVYKLEDSGHPNYIASSEMQT